MKDSAQEMATSERDDMLRVLDYFTAARHGEHREEFLPETPAGNALLDLLAEMRAENVTLRANIRSVEHAIRDRRKPGETLEWTIAGMFVDLDRADQDRAALQLLHHVDGLPPRYLLVRAERDRRGDDVSRREVEISDWALVLIGRVLSLLASDGSPVVIDGSEEVTTEQAAALLGVSRPTMVAMIQRGELTARVVGRRHRRLRVRDILAARQAHPPK